MMAITVKNDWLTVRKLHVGISSEKSEKTSRRYQQWEVCLLGFVHRYWIWSILRSLGRNVGLLPRECQQQTRCFGELHRGTCNVSLKLLV